MSVNATPVSFSGPQPLALGTRVYGCPRGSKVAHAATRGLCYILLPSGALHCLREDGEVPIPRVLVDALKARYFGLRPDEIPGASSVHPDSGRR